MKETFEFYGQKFTIDPELDKYNHIVSSPQKMARANEIFAKYPLPKEWEDEIGENERENTFWVKGKLCQANVDTHSFLIVVAATDTQPQMSYTVTTPSDVLNKLMKDYRNCAVNVHIKPKKETEGQYEFIDVV